MKAFSFVKMTSEKTSTLPRVWDVRFAPSGGDEVLLQQNHLSDQWAIQKHWPEGPGRFWGSLTSRLRKVQNHVSCVLDVALPLAVWPGRKLPNLSGSWFYLCELRGPSYMFIKSLPGRAPGDGEGQGSLVCCSAWGSQSQTWLSNSTTTTKISSQSAAPEV